MPTIRPATRADLAAVARLAMLHSGGEHTQWQARLAGDLTRAHTCLLVADDHGQVTGYGRARRFDPPASGPPNLAPAGYYLTGLGFSEVTRDFTYPGVTFAGGTGVLYRAPLTPGPARQERG